MAGTLPKNLTIASHKPIWAGTGWLQHTTEWKYLTYSKYSINISCPLSFTRHRFFLPCHITIVWWTLSLWTLEEMRVIVVIIYVNKTNLMWRCLHLKIYLKCSLYNTCEGHVKCPKIHLAESLWPHKEIDWHCLQQIKLEIIKQKR